MRLDSGFDAAETMLAIRDERVDFVISVNPRGEDSQIWIKQAAALPASHLSIAALDRSSI